MMSFEYDWDGIITEASKLSSPVGPTKLLSLLHDKENPWTIDGRELWNARQSDLAAVYLYQNSGRPILDNDRAMFVDRMAWLLGELNACHDEPLSLSKLAVILAVSNAFSFEKTIWERIPSEGISDNLLAGMATFVGATQCGFTSRGFTEPIWEREAVDEFMEADENENWIGLEALWQTMAPAFQRDIDLQEATACLCVNKRGRQLLAGAVDKFDSMLQVINVAAGMNSSQIASVAPLLKTSRGRFGFVQSLAFHHPRNETLPDDTNNSLATLFKEIQKEKAEWEKWMIALNRYPVRTKALQPAFGISLVKSLKAAKSAYIEAIDLSSRHNESRLAVTDCFAMFAKSADQNQRKQMWRLAHAHWAKWNFGRAETDHYITSMSVSELDYAVIGYFLENLSKSERSKMLHRKLEQMNYVVDMWHRDINDYNTAWYQALSTWQIYYYSQQVVEGREKWELPTKTHIPFDPAKYRYCAMTFPTNAQ